MRACGSESPHISMGKTVGQRRMKCFGPMSGGASSVQRRIDDILGAAKNGSAMSCSSAAQESSAAQGSSGWTPSNPGVGFSTQMWYLR